MHAVTGTDAEAMYDIWLNGLNKEVMFWVDNHAIPLPGRWWPPRRSAARHGICGRPAAGTGRSSARVTPPPARSICSPLAYLESRGDLAATDKLWQVNFGWEICSTAGSPETFTVSNYSVDSTPSS